MDSGELALWNWAVSGWASRSFFVRLSYSLSAPLKINWKLDDEAAVR